MSQNGFDNGGISGVCKWAQLPDEVEFVLSVLERLAKRYGHRQALMGIEIINEPNTTTSCVFRQVGVSCLVMYFFRV